MLFTTEKNNFKIKNKQETPREVYNPFALSLPVFWNINKNIHDMNV